MTLTEIRQWRKALKETRERWKRAYWSNLSSKWILGRQCPLCELSISDDCLDCVYIKMRGGARCILIIETANRTHSRRPIYAAIRRCERYLDRQERAIRAKRREGK